MSPSRRAFTLIELSVALVLIGLTLSVAYAWVAISSKTANVALRGAVRSTDQERLIGELREDLAQAVRLSPDPKGNAFTLDLAREDGGIDRVRYACVRIGPRMRLVRTWRLASGESAGRAVASGVESCSGELVAGKTWRVRIAWAGGSPGSELVVEVVRRLGLLE